MPRRSRPVKRVIAPDPVYQSEAIAKFVNVVMSRGKRSTAEKVVYDALSRAGKQAKKEPLEVFDLALRNATPLLEVKPRRVGGATYQVPVEIRPERRLALARRWAQDIGARLTLASTANTGACFRLELPSSETIGSQRTAY